MYYSGRALVPYGGGVCCHHHHHQQDLCCSSPTPSTVGGGGSNNALQVMPGVEERLLQLEGDKDSLHMQVGLIRIVQPFAAV